MAKKAEAQPAPTNMPAPAPKTGVVMAPEGVDQAEYNAVVKANLKEVKALKEAETKAVKAMLPALHRIGANMLGLIKDRDDSLNGVLEAMQVSIKIHVTKIRKCMAMARAFEADDIPMLLAAGLSISHVEELTRLSDANDRMRFLEMARDEGLSVRDLREKIDNEVSEDPKMLTDSSQQRRKGVKTSLENQLDDPAKCLKLASKRADNYKEVAGSLTAAASNVSGLDDEKVLSKIAEDAEELRCNLENLSSIVQQNIKDVQRVAEAAAKGLKGKK